jgi:serine/threonine-protein kinase
VPERVALVAQVCEALAVAHRQGIAHRDIKPGNVLVDARGQPRLIDFGIAKVLDSASVEMELPETRLGHSLMTPEYASPEQIAGRPVTTATDVYSMGVLLYELLTGSRPHQMAGLSLVEMERLVLGTVPVDPSRRVLQRRARPPDGLGDPAALGRRLRGDLDRIVMTAMRLESDQRYASVEALADDLERYLSGKPVAARGASSLYRASRFVARHRTGVAATAAAFLLLATASGLALHQANEARAQRDLAESEAERAAAARDFLVDMIKRADPFENADSPTLAGALRQALPDLDRKFVDQPELEASLRYAVGYALQNLGEIDVAREQFERALALRRDATAAERAEVLDGLAIIAWWESDFDQAAAGFKHALDVLDEPGAVLSDHGRNLRVTVLANWSAMLIDSGDYARSEELALKALDTSVEAPSVPMETMASIWSTIATSREGLGRKQEALAAFQRSLEIQREATGEMHPSYALVLNNLALLYYGMDRLGDAISAMTESVRIRRATLGDRHPQTATALFNLARLQTLAGDLDAAETHAEEALSVALEGYPAGHPRIGKAHEALAVVLEARGEHAAALREVTTAITIYRNADGVDPAWIEKAGEMGDRIVQRMQGRNTSGAPGTPP